LEYQTDGDYTNALSCLDKALEIDPKNAKAYHYKGNIFAKLEKYQEAMECYEQALKIDPNPKYASGISRLLGMVTKYIVNKEKGAEQVAEHLQQNIQESIDDTTNKTLDSTKRTNTQNTQKEGSSVVAPKVTTPDTPR
jgi:tetratricopeptide (TPR) repeat protein